MNIRRTYSVNRYISNIVVRTPDPSTGGNNVVWYLDELPVLADLLLLPAAVGVIPVTYL